MTVEVRVPVIAYAGNGTAAPLAVPFRFLETAHLTVTRVTGDVEEELVRGTHYSVTGAGAMEGGAVTPVAPIPLGVVWRVVRITPRQQPTRYEDGFYSAATQELALDRQMMAVQELGEIADRAITVPHGETGGTVPPLADRVGLVAVFTSGGGLTGVQSFGFVGGTSMDDGLWSPSDIPLDDGPWG